jgi:hypothetical protein
MRDVPEPEVEFEELVAVRSAKMARVTSVA